MNNNLPFSEEYNISNITDSQDFDKKELLEKEKIMEKIESDYLLSKPRREIKRAKVIKE